MLIKAIGKCFGENCGEVVVADCPPRSCRAKKRKVALLVVSDRVNIVRPQPAIAFSAVVLDAAAFIRMIRVLKPAALKIGEVMRGLKLACEVRITKSCLASVGSR